MVKQICGLVFFLVLSFSSLAQDSANVDIWHCPEGHMGETLDIFNWYDYVAEDTLNNFETACGVTINYSEYDEEYLMYDRLRLGNPGYDLVIASSTLVMLLAQDRLLVSLNHDLIPNEVHINPSFLNPSYDPGNLYSLPYMWGSTGMAYRKEQFPNGIHSWEEFWTHEDGPVIWLDDKRAILGITLLNLGYSPNTSNAHEILEARDYLGEHGTNLLGIYGYSEVTDLILTAEADIAITYNGTLSTLITICGCNDYGYSIPEEGSNIFVDNMIIPVDSDNADLGMIFMDYILQPEINAAISNLGFGSTNLMAIESGLINTQFLEESGFNPSKDVLSRMFYINPLDEISASHYDVAWNDLLQFYGVKR